MPFKIVRNDITRCERYDAITCGVYGCMMHTAFCDKSHSQEVFDNMKRDLQEFIDKDTFNTFPFMRTKQHQRAIDTGKDSASINISYKDYICPGM